MRVAEPFRRCKRRWRLKRAGGLFFFAEGTHDRLAIIFDEWMVIDVGWLENSPLGFCQLGGPLRKLAAVVASGKVEVFGREAIEQRAALLLATPGQGAMRRRLVEDEQIAGLAGNVTDGVLLRLPLQDLAWAGIVGLVAAGDTAEAAVAGVHVRQLILQHDYAAAHPAILIRVVLRAIEVVSGTVQDQALRSSAAAEQERLVVQPPAAAEHRVQIGNGFRMG